MTHDDDDKKPRALGLSPAQVLGSALAAMSVAFFASWAGTAGTLIGAAFGSVIATVGAATYTWSLQRTSEAAKRTAAIVKQRSLITGTLPRTIAQGPLREDHVDQPPPMVADTPTDTPLGPDYEDADPDDESRWWQLPWAKLALVSLAVMVVGMAGITAVEVVTGKPIASLFGHDETTGTTLGHRLGTDTSSKDDTTPTKQTPATPDATPSAEPTQEPQQPEPSTTPVPTPTPSTPPDATVPPVQSQAPAPGGTQP